MPNRDLQCSCLRAALWRRGAVAGAAWALLGVAHAADPVSAADASPVVLDVTRGLVFSNAELVAMGGAGAAFASGGIGMLLSPAAPSNRRMEGVNPHTGSLVLLQSKITDRRVTGAGDAEAEGVRVFNVGASYGHRDVAGGLLAAGAYYPVEDAAVTVAEGHASLAVTILDGGLAVGVGPRLLFMRVASGGEHHDYLGSGIEGGVVVSDIRDAWSFAATARSPVWAGPLSDTQAGIAAANLPTELILGAGWSNRAYLPEGGGGVPVRLAVDVAVDAPVADAVALENALRGERVTRGGWYTVAPHLGAEVDVWPGRLRLRAGSYLEPSRTALAGPRPHATGGFELRVFRIKLLGGKVKLDLAWQIGVDYAPRYFHGAWLGINLWQEGQMGGRPGVPAARAP